MTMSRDVEDSSVVDDAQAQLAEAAVEALLVHAGEAQEESGVSAPAVTRGTSDGEWDAKWDAKLKEVSSCYLDIMGEEESTRLVELRRRLPSLCKRVRDESAKAGAKTHLLFWGVDLEKKSDATDIILLKHLRAEQGMVNVTAERLVQTLIYRAEECIDELGETTLASVGERFAAAGMFGGVDVQGRPVVVSRTPAGQDADSLMADIPSFVRYNFWLKEQAFKRIAFKRGAPEDLCQIVDLSTAKFGPPPKAVRESSVVFKRHCPESNGVNIFVNVPSVVVGAFKLCRRFIDQRTYDKIRILGAGEHLELFKLVPPESLPLFIGGMLQQPPSPLAVPCHVVSLQPGATVDVKMIEVGEYGAGVRWEVRVCSDQAATFEISFLAAASGVWELVASSATWKPLDATEGVISDRFEPTEAGSLHCRFACEAARFGARARPRVCIARAGVSEA